MNKKPMIITSGIDSEYVIGGLCQFLRNRGYTVTEINFSHFHENPAEFLSRFKDESVVYITSAHVNLTFRTTASDFPNFEKLYPNYLAPIEIIPLLQPKLSLYIPHDLMDPYGGGGGPNELRFMDLFDHIIAPTEAKLLRSILPRNTQVHDAGWIKYIEEDDQETLCLNDEIEVLLLITMIENLRTRYGIDGFAQYLLPLLQENVHIKLPLWKDTDIIENALRQAGCTKVIPAHYSATALIKRAQVVVANGVSSIHAESSLLGRPTVCLLDKEWMSTSSQKQKLKVFPNIYFHDYSNREPLSKSVVEQLSAKVTSPLIQPFQYSLIEKIIENS